MVATPATVRRGIQPASRGRVHVGPPTLEVVREYFIGDALLASLKKADRISLMVEALTSFAEHDAHATLNRERAGEIYYNFLLQPLEVQRQFTTKMCEINKIAPPNYADEKKQGRQESGRNQLAWAVYGKWKDMFEIVPGSRDSRAGKNITSAVRAYKIKAGLIQPRARTGATVQPVPKTGSQMFVTLLSVATDEEMELLDELAKRAGIDELTIARWHRNLESIIAEEERPPQEEAPAPAPASTRAA